MNVNFRPTILILEKSRQYNWVIYVKSNFFLLLPGSVLSGICVYFVLSYVLVANKITLPLSIIITVLIFGLGRYYSVDRDETTSDNDNGQKKEMRTSENNLSNIIFIIIYVVLLVVLVNFTFHTNLELFVDWEKITTIQIIGLTAAIGFSFFLPGYALVTILGKKCKLSRLPKLLLAYLFSILLTGLGGYIAGLMGFAISDIRIFFIGSYLLLFLLSLFKLNAFNRGFYRVNVGPNAQLLSTIPIAIKNNHSQFILFLSLFALVIFYTFYINDGKIVVDQWYHHGRALLISSGFFKDLGPIDPYVPPFFSAMLASFFNLSNSPSVNSYVSIGFLNIVPVFAFYYFFTKWMPRRKRRASMLAATLFMLSSGFGWIYVLNTGIESHQDTFDVSSSINILDLATAKTYDIGKPTTFVDVGHPDITTSLIIIALPTGFTLLGLLRDTKTGFSTRVDNDDKQRQPKTNLVFIPIITALSILGILSHDEFYIFIICASVAIVLINRALPINVNYSMFYASFLISITLVVVVDIFISPARFYSLRTLVGVPLIALSFLFVSFCWAVYMAFCKIKYSKFNFDLIKKRAKKIMHLPILNKIKSVKFLDSHQIRLLKLSLAVLIVSAVAYLYLFTVLVWSDLSVQQIYNQTREYTNVPWYLYPIKFGLTGLLGLAFILSYLFKKFEREIFIFGIIAIITFFAGPYYDEHRFGKYIMTSMAAFAALLVYKIISSVMMKLKPGLRHLLIGISLGGVVTSSCLSIFMFAGYVDLSMSKSYLIEDSRRDFPTSSEIRLLSFLTEKASNSKAFNTIVLEKETSLEKGFVTKIYGFTPVPREKLLQNPLALNASSLENLYDILNKNDVNYIVLPKKDINIKLSSVIRFLVDSFPRAYEDNNYIVLHVLPLTPVSPKTSDVAFLYQNDFRELSPTIYNKSSVTPVDSSSVRFPREQESTRNNSNYDNNFVLNGIENENKYISSTAAILTVGNFSENGSKSVSLWSLPIEEIQGYNNTNSVINNGAYVNYIEGNFRIIDDFPITNELEKNNGDKYAAGLLWEDGKREYILSIGNVGLELSQRQPSVMSTPKQSQQSTNDDYVEKQISINEGVKRQKGIWYNLKILFLKYNIEIYVNDILRIKVPAGNHYQSSSVENNITIPAVSRVGINTFYSKTQFYPLTLGHISESSESFKKIYHSNYYPLSVLALSKVKYDTFLDNDLTAFSRKYVVLPFNPPFNQENAAKYLEYVRNGGNLIIMNSENNFEGLFNKLFPVKVGNLTNFSSIESFDPEITGIEKRSINVSGTTKNIQVYPASNFTVKSYYVNKDKKDDYQRVAPFEIEKRYGNGKIVLLNMMGYFDAISPESFTLDNTSYYKSKNQNFMTLSNIAPMIGLPYGKLDIEKNWSSSTNISLARIIGDLKASSGQTITINSSSLLLPDIGAARNTNSYNLSASIMRVSAGPNQNISIIDNKLPNSNGTYTSYIADDKINFNVKSANNYSIKKVRLNNLTLYGGPYEIIIKLVNSSRPLYLPTTSSYNDYVSMSVPKGFDMTIKFPDNNSTFAQLDMIDKRDKKETYHTLRVSPYDNNYTNGLGTGQISLYNVKPDVESIRYISALMKSPEIKITKQAGEKMTEDQSDTSNTAVSFHKNSPDSNAIEIPKSGNITIKVDRIDNYQQNNHQIINTQFLTYLKEDIHSVNNVANVNSGSLEKLLLAKLAMPGDISNYAKQHDILVPWQNTLGSQENVIITISIIFGFVMAIVFFWFKLMRVEAKLRLNQIDWKDIVDLDK